MTGKRKRVTLQDVARQAGVSAMTVSRVINHTGRISPATRQHVFDVIEQLDYRPSRAARTLVTARTRMIGVIVPDITNPYFAEIVHGIEDVAWEADYSVLLANSNENPTREAALLRQIDDTAVDGLIPVSSRLADDDLRPLLAPHRAVVTINRQFAPIASCVRSRNGYGFRAYQSALYLMRAGHRQIGYINLQRSIINMQIDELIERMAGYDFVIRREWCATSLPTWEGGYVTGQRLLAEQPCLTAIVAGNDLVALGVMRAAIESGRRIPQDLALIGGDDILLASQVTPPLTTFSVPKYEMGANAARLLFKRMEGDLTYREYLFDEVFIERGSAP